MRQESSSTLDACPLLPSTAALLGVPPSAILVPPSPDGWYRVIFVHFTFPRKCDGSGCRLREA